MRNKIIFGLSNIHVCKDEDSTPIPIKGAISVEIEISTEKTYMYVNGCNKILMGTTKNASGKLQVIGLSQDELALLLGYKQDVNGGILVDDGLNAKRFHLLFSQETANGDKLLYHVFKVRFNLPSISGNTIDDNSIDFNEVTLDLDIEYSDEYNGYYYMMNSNTNNEIAKNWFIKLQNPKQEL